MEGGTEEIAREKPVNVEKAKGHSSMHPANRYFVSPRMRLMHPCGGISPDLLDVSLDGQCVSYFSHALDRVSYRSNLERFKLVPGGGEGIVVEDLCQDIGRAKHLVI